MFKALAGDYGVWFVLLLLVGKMVATSLTLGVGGSGGVFAPSLFVGLMSGTAFGIVADHVFGAAAGDPALYAAVGMAGVFSSATRAPLTALASVVEMTGDYSITLSIMLTVAVATVMSRALSYGTIYTTKLLRRGQDIDRTAPWRAFTGLSAEEVMRPAQPPLAVPAEQPGTVFASESIVEVLRHLQTEDRDEVPVLSEDGRYVVGSASSRSILHAIGRRLAVHPRR